MSLWRYTVKPGETCGDLWQSGLVHAPQIYSDLFYRLLVPALARTVVHVSLSKALDHKLLLSTQE